MRDIVVIGAGPAGLHAAYRLADAGLDVVLLEAQTRVGEGAVCSGVIGEEAFARFALPTHPVLTKIHKIQAVSPRGRIMEYRTDAPLARVVSKEKFNRALAVRAVGAGVDLRPGRRVESLAREKHGLVVRFRSGEDERGEVKARLAVIASGVNCSLNRLLGLALPTQFLRAMQADVPFKNGSLPTATRVFVGRSVAPGGFGWEIPLRNGHMRVGVMTTHNPKPYFAAILRQGVPAVDESQLDIGQKGIAQAPVGRCTTERILAVGEAAGHVKTSTGGGIYYGLLSAQFATETIMRAFRRGDFTSRSLADFERYWRTAFGNELLVGYFARRLASSFPDSLIERIFETVNGTNLLARLNGSLKFDWHHRALLTSLRSLLAVPTPVGSRGFPCAVNKGAA